MFGKVNDAYETVKNGLEVKIALATAEQKDELANAKMALAELKSAFADLKEENQSLKEQLRERDHYVFDKGVYWRTDDAAQNQPFCPVCYAHGKVIPLKKSQDGRNKAQTHWRCTDTKCAATFNPFDYCPPRNVGVVRQNPNWQSW